jgi:hypothetical protein
MSSRPSVAQLLFCCFAFVLPAAAQLDSAALHAKYGSPLNRETFHMPAGFDLVVDYGAYSDACRLQVPALMPTTEQVSNAAVMNRRMYDLLAELVPDSMRGKEISRMASSMGALSVQRIEYEHVTISEFKTAQPFDHDNVITVTFTSPNCRTVARK